MLSGKQRSYLKGIAHSVKPITQIGKNGITDSVVEELDLALEARELIKVSLLETSMLTAQEAAEETSKLLNAEFVQAIGSKFVIYRKSTKNPKIQLPKS